MAPFFLDKNTPLKKRATIEFIGEVAPTGCTRGMDDHASNGERRHWGTSPFESSELTTWVMLKRGGLEEETRPFCARCTCCAGNFGAELEYLHSACDHMPVHCRGNAHMF
jgi:hypothetical protein